MDFINLQIEKNEFLATVKINRPQAMNALNGELLQELGMAIIQLGNDPEIKAVVITGAGEKAFVAGADIASMKAMTALDAKRFCDLGHELMRQIETCPKPVIAAVNGFCLGG